MKIKYSIFFVLIFSGLLNAQNLNQKTFVDQFKQNCWRADDCWLAKDKLQHFSTSTFMFVTNYYYQNEYTDFDDPIRTSYTVSLSLGIGKEVFDFFGSNKYFSLKDLVVDFAGNVAGHLIVSAIK